MKISCKTCGANLEYVPSIQKAHCEHCGNYFNLSEIRFDDSIYEELEQYTCSSCGAELISDGKTGIVKCIYCGGKEFVRGKTNKDYVLNGIFPFEIDKEEFVKCYKDYCENHIEDIKIEFKNELKNAKIIGYYLPYSFANNFYEKQYSRILNELLEEIIPYNFKKLKQMNPLYLDGFIAEIIKTKKEENDIKTSDPTFFWVPVWISYIEYNGDDYYIVMNGQTGEMAGIYKKDEKIKMAGNMEKSTREKKRHYSSDSKNKFITRFYYQNSEIKFGVISVLSKLNNRKFKICLAVIFIIIFLVVFTEEFLMVLFILLALAGLRFNVFPFHIHSI